GEVEPLSPWSGGSGYGRERNAGAPAVWCLPSERAPGEYRPFALGPPSVTAQRPVVAQHVVTWDEPGDGIRAHGVTHRPVAACYTRRTRERGIAGWASCAELEQCTPDLDLKVGASNCEPDG